MPIKLKDIADELGVSASTISKVINNRPGVGEELRNKILDKIDQMDLRPKQNIGGLIKEDDISVNLFIRINKTVENDPFYSLIQEGISKELQKYKCNLLLHILNENTIEDEPFREIFQNKVVHGNILIGADYETDFLKRVRNLNTPTVLVDNTFPGLNSVNINNFQGALKAIDHFIEMGHKRIAFLSGPLEHSSIEKRYEGYKEGINKLSSNNQPLLIKSNGVSVNDGYNAINGASLKGYTAIFAATDKLAIGAIKALKEQGFEVPNDISIIGFDDIEWSLHTEPSLTSVSIPKQQIGKSAARLFLDLYDDPDLCGVDMKIDSRLVKRQSVKRIG